MCPCVLRPRETAGAMTADKTIGTSRLSDDAVRDRLISRPYTRYCGAVSRMGPAPGIRGGRRPGSAVSIPPAMHRQLGACCSRTSSRNSALFRRSIIGTQDVAAIALSTARGRWDSVGTEVVRAFPFKPCRTPSPCLIDVTGSAGSFLRRPTAPG